MKPSLLASIVLASFSLLATPVSAQTASDEQIDAAIQRGVQHLWSTQRDSGLFSDLDPQDIPTTNRYLVVEVITIGYHDKAFQRLFGFSRFLFWQHCEAMMFTQTQIT